MLLEHHGSQEVAQLIYDSAPEMFALLFGQTAVQTIQKLVQRSHNRFSHRYVRVAESAHRVVGIATILPAIALTDDADYSSVLSAWAQLRWKLAHRLILDRVLEHTYPADTFYIANLAVHPDYRGNGIGTQLLLHCIAEAQASDANQVFISVDINNPRAQKLYESLGFQVVATKTISLLRKTIGSHVLALSLRDD
ncbi:MAG: hypothetical protein Kow00121_34450 [Elainellaceae cyanobacterium]